MEHVLEFFIDLFTTLWRADDRPEARQFVAGCVVVILLMAASIALAWWLW